MANNSEIQAISKFFKIISDSTRLSILYLLKENKRNVSEIVEVLDMEQSAISHQLRILKDSRLVRSHREGKSMIYQLDDDHIFDILNQVRIHINEREHE
jgi:DNA-binding transcriptional ArsR family regulator